MKFLIIQFTIVITLLNSAAFAKTPTQNELSITASAYGFMVACVREGFVLTTQTQSVIKKHIKSKLFSQIAANEMKGYSMDNCKSSFEENYSSTGVVSREIGFQLISYVGKGLTNKARFEISSAAEIAYMDKVCKKADVGIDLTSKARKLIKKANDLNKPMFSAIYNIGEEDFGIKGACDTLLFNEFNINSEKTKRLGFEVWKEKCPATSMGKNGCIME